jgi:Fe-Mn family superoxide dismutase
MPEQTIGGTVSRRTFLLSAAGGVTLLCMGMAGINGCTSGTGGASSVALPELPYKEHALEPYITRKTIGFHYGKHHRAYVDKTLELVKGSSLASLTWPTSFKRLRDLPTRPRSSTTQLRPGTTIFIGRA